MAKKEKNNQPKKKNFGKKLLKFIIIVLVIAAIVAIAGYLLYSFYPVKTLSFCIENTPQKTPLNCTSDLSCMDSLLNQQNSGGQGVPEIFKPLFTANLQETIKCVNNLCDVYMIRESIQCLANENLKTIKITIKSVIPPSMALGLIKQIISTTQLPTMESLQNLK